GSEGESNPWPPPCEGGALPAELSPRRPGRASIATIPTMTQVRGRGSIPVVLMAVLLLAAACQVPSRAATPTPSATPSQDRRLLAADARMYGGDYDGAGTAYRG